MTRANQGSAQIDVKRLTRSGGHASPVFRHRKPSARESFWLRDEGSPAVPLLCSALPNDTSRGAICDGFSLVVQALQGMDGHWFVANVREPELGRTGLGDGTEIAPDDGRLGRRLPILWVPEDLRFRRLPCRLRLIRRAAFRAAVPTGHPEIG
jgi:hypothetical protein